MNAARAAKPNLTRHFHPASPVAGIAPVDGWSLWGQPDWTGDSLPHDEYFARHAEHGDVAIDHSRFNFSPSQDRFAWLVMSGFPARPNPFGGWTDSEIDDAMRQPFLRVVS